MFESCGAAGDLIDKVKSAFRTLEDIASPALISEIRRTASANPAPQGR